MEKKAQVTVFILIGMLLISSFSFIAIMSNSAVESTSSAEAAKQEAMIFQSSTLNYYISTCLADAAKEALLLAGKQAGFILPLTPRGYAAAYWNFDTGDEKAEDVTGHNHHASKSNVEFYRDEAGGAYKFNGGDSRLEVPYSPALWSRSMSITAWVNPAPASVSGRKLVAGSYGGQGFAIGMNSGKFSAWAPPPSGPIIDASSSTAPSIDEWYHIIGTYDSNSKEIRLYVNGELESNITSGMTVPTPLNPANFSIGGSAGADYFSGFIDEVGIFTKSLSQNEAKKIYDIYISGNSFLDFPEYSIINWPIKAAPFGKARVPFLIARPDMVNEVESPPLYPCKRQYTDPVWGPRWGPSYVGEKCHKKYGHTDRVLGFGVHGKEENLIPPFLCTEPLNILGYECRCDNPPCVYSIQRQLETYIAAKTFDCVNLERLQKSFPGYEISKGNPHANISFSRDEVSVRLDFPVNMTFRGRHRATKLLHYFTTQPVRLLEMYDIVHGALQDDIKDVTYDFKNALQEQVHAIAYPNYVVGESKLGDGTSVFTITDDNRENRINNQNFQFVFSRENRNPALDYITNTPARDDVDIRLMEGEDIIIMPEAYDPDEDNLKYEYSGWKVEWDDVYESPLCGSAVSAAFTSKEPYTGDNLWHDSPLYSSGEDPAMGKNCSGSETGRCASYTTECHDVGEHELNLKITDEYGNEDYQIIKILVNDIPNAILEAYNLYSYSVMGVMPLFIASVEDPFFIDASKSTNYIGGDIAFDWEIIPPSGPVDTFPGYTGYNLTLPDDFNERDVFTRIRDGYSYFMSAGTYEARVRVYETDIPSNKNEIKEEIEVKDCIPHHKSGTNPYPFDKETNPYEATHACCDSSYQYKDKGTECFAIVEYGSKDYFLANNVFDFEHTAGTYISPDIINMGDSNDIHKRTFEATCSGMRGNICGGITSSGAIDTNLAANTIEKVYDCPEDKGPGLEEVCFAADYKKNPAEPFDPSALCRPKPRVTICGDAGGGYCYVCGDDGSCTGTESTGYLGVTSCS